MSLWLQLATQKKPWGRHMELALAANSELHG